MLYLQAWAAPFYEIQNHRFISSARVQGYTISKALVDSLNNLSSNVSDMLSNVLGWPWYCGSNLVETKPWPLSFAYCSPRKSRLMHNARLFLFIHNYPCPTNVKVSITVGTQACSWPGCIGCCSGCSYVIHLIFMTILELDLKDVFWPPSEGRAKCSLVVKQRASSVAKCVVPDG